ncbi:putative ABC transporter protein [Cokeromyces recurvatus]|uniref:putative ABC transporter protein n=1 Tax=Cokeromyces recurvatus TaxID=90255 RepID=UPI00221F4B8D|nr:putative ABC transporter protein [Cokeromyces recurvatus]KAI7903880.1 putative ABC transporter protein [Cokeromyces recurvatus]
MTDLNAEHEGTAPSFPIAPDNASIITNILPIPSQEELDIITGKKHKFIRLKRIPLIPQLISKIYKRKENSIPIHKLFRFASKFDLFLIFCAVICSAGTGAIQPISIIFMGNLLTDLSGSLSQPSQLLDACRPVILIFVYIGTATMIASYISNCFWIMAGENQAQRIKRKYMHSIMYQDMAWFDKADDGSLVTRLSSDIQLIQDGISEKFGLFIVCLVQFVTGFIVAFVEGWRLAVIMLVTIPVMGLTGALMGYFITKYTLRSQDEYASAGSIAEQVFSGIRTVYSFSLQDRFGSLYEKKLDKALKAGIKRGTVLGVGFGAFIFILFSTYGLTFWYGGRLIRQGDIEGPTVMVVFYSMMIGAMSLLMLPPNLSAVSSACGSAYKIFSTIDRIPEINREQGPRKVVDNLMGAIEFRHVKFSYPTRPNLVILKDLCLSVKPGQTVAFVGASGSGKSTSIQLLQRFYDPINGNILLDGVDIKDLDLIWLRQQLGVVSQEPVLFNMSIRQNLLLGVSEDSKVTEEDLIRACTEANCHSFISKLPDGYDTLVGDQGSMLSGGQKQRIAIARAILKNPPILLLDEATSALDTQSERLVQKALDAASAKRTTIVIAHRLSTIRNADLIVVMNHGQLVESGTHQELIHLGGIYAELVKKQEIALQQKAAQKNTSDSEKPFEDQPDEDELLLQKLHKKNQTIINKKDVSVMMMEHADNNEKRPSTIANSNTYSSLHTATNENNLYAYELKIQREKQNKKEIKKRSAPVKRVLFDMRPEFPRLVLGCIGAAIAGAIFPIYSLLFAKVITIITIPGHSDLYNTGPFKGINLYAFLFVVIGIVGFIGFALQVVSFEVAGEYYTRRLRAAVFRTYMKQEAGFFDQDENHAGALTSRLAVDAKNVNEMVTKVWGDVIQVTVTCIVGLVIAFVYSWILTLIILCLVPFILGATSQEARIHRGYEDGTKRANAQSGEVAGEAIKEIRTVTALNRQKFFEDRYDLANKRPHKMAIRRAYLSSIGFGLLRGIMIYTSAVAFYAGIRLIMDGRIEFLDMFTCMMSIMITAQTAGHGSVFTSTFSKAKVAAIAIFDIMDRKPVIDPEMEGIEPSVGSLEGDVDFKDIAFSYPSRPNNPIFTGQFNLHAEKGMTIALVGPSGCGKSTTIGMLQRWYDPFGGQISLDNYNIQSFTLRNLRSHMALVGQEPVLFDMSIGDNVRFGIDNRYNITKHEGDGDDYSVSQEEVEEACRQANIHDFIMTLPDGYNTRVGDKGSQLSGGQKQRIAIARALIRRPKLLLLDEATSALDSDSEKVVQEALDKIIEQGGRTTITIAHRLSTIQNADLICVVKDGVVAEQGTHWDLLSLNGIYSILVHEQSLQA